MAKAKDILIPSMSGEWSYILGLIYADGYIHKGGLEIKLKESDGYILKQIGGWLKYNLELNPRFDIVKRKDGFNGENSLRMRIHSVKFAKLLNSYGLKSNKSLTLKWPTSGLFMKDFIRGYIDGDGCICNSSNKLYTIILGSYDFLNGLSDYLHKTLSFNKRSILKHNNSKISKIAYSTTDSKNLCDWIYSAPLNFFLVRKHSKYLSYIEASVC